MEERKKAGLLPIDEIVDKNIRQIELKDHTITISDIDNLTKLNKAESEEDDDEEDDDVDNDLDKQQLAKKSNVSKNFSKINEKLLKLEKHKKLLDQQNLKQNPSKAKKKKNNSLCNKSTKKFQIKDVKCKRKKRFKS